MITQKKKILFLNQTAVTQESLEVLLIATTFDQNISVMLLKQNPAQLNNLLTTLSLYNIDNIYLEKNVACEIPIKILTAQELGSIMQQHDVILNF